MKNLLAFFALFGVLCSFTYMAGMEDVVAGIRKGNAAQVARYFDNTVDITLPNKSNSYSRSQAEIILKDFFRTRQVNDFEIIHKGENAGAEYCIGTLVTVAGNYRTTVYMKQKLSRQTLQEIRFENR